MLQVRGRDTPVFGVSCVNKFLALYMSIVTLLITERVDNFRYHIAILPAGNKQRQHTK